MFNINNISHKFDFIMKMVLGEELFGNSCQNMKKFSLECLIKPDYWMSVKYLFPGLLVFKNWLSDHIQIRYNKLNNVQGIWSKLKL